MNISVASQSAGSFDVEIHEGDNGTAADTLRNREWYFTVIDGSTGVGGATDSQTLSYNSTTHELSISNGNTVTFPEANASTDGILSSDDWNTFNGKENVLTFSGNGLFSRSGDTVTGLSCATAGQVARWDGSNFTCQTLATDVTSLNTLNGALTLAAGTAGTDFNVTTSGSTITYNLPSASTTARGAVTTGAQTFGGAKTFNVGTAAVAFRATDGALPYFTIDTSNRRVQIGSSTSDANGITLILDSYNLASDPTGVNGSLYYNSSFGKFRCYENGTWKDCIGTRQVRSFIDTTIDSAADNNTTNYWDTSAENNSSYPNLSPSSAAKSITGMVSFETASGTSFDRSIVARVERSIGSPAACGSGTPVGTILSTFTTNNGEHASNTMQFVDNPATTSTVYYTLCADSDTSNAGSMDIERIRFTLEEATNTN